MRPIAFLTMSCLDGFVVYDHLAVKPLELRGWSVTDVAWDDPDVRWNDYDAVVIRSPWDYHHRLDEFLDVLDHIDQTGTRLIHSPRMVRWNIDKTYLRDLESAGLPIVPTIWSESLSTSSLDQAFDHFAVNELVVKPTISAGARDTFRVRQSHQSNSKALVIVDGDGRCIEDIEHRYRKQAAMIQPFLPSVVLKGEWSLFYFGGEYSHCVLKTPKAGDFRVQEEFGSCLRAVTPPQDMLRLAESILRATIEPTVYARVDLVRMPVQPSQESAQSDDRNGLVGEPVIMEVELIEPSLYFPYDDLAPERFARALDAALRRPPVPRPMDGADCEPSAVETTADMASDGKAPGTRRTRTMRPANSTASMDQNSVG